MNKDEDLLKAFNMLGELKPAEIFELSRIPKDRRSTFISCAKQYADAHHNITFNKYYTKIRKDERF